MSEIRSVGDIREEAQRNGDDRSAVRRSVAMALLGVAAIAVSAFLPKDEHFAPTRVAPVARVPVPVAPADDASQEGARPVGEVFFPQQLPSIEEPSTLRKTPPRMNGYARNADPGAGGADLRR